MRAIRFSVWGNSKRHKKVQIHREAVFCEGAAWELSVNIFRKIFVVSLFCPKKMPTHNDQVFNAKGHQ